MSEQKKYPQLSKSERRELNSLGSEYRNELKGYGFGTFITGGEINKDDGKTEVRYEVEFLTEDQILEKSRLLWLQDMETGEFAVLDSVGLKDSDKTPEERMEEEKENKFALVEISSADGRFTVLGSVINRVAPLRVSAISDNENDVLYDDGGEPANWTKYDDLSVDAKIAISEYDWDGIWYALTRAAKIPEPSQEDILETFNEMESKGLTREITIKPFQKLLKENKFNLTKDSKSFFKTMDYIENELKEIYGDDSIVWAMTDFFGQLVDDEFIVNDKSIMPKLSANQFNKRMTKVVDKALAEELSMKLGTPEIVDGDAIYNINK